MTDKQLALWMLEKMQNSEEFLHEIRAARVKGRPDMLDKPELVGKHKARLKHLFQSGEEDSVDVPADVAGVLAALTERDAISSREELIEKMISAYLDQHADGSKGLPEGWQTTVELARAEIEGRTSGQFRDGFVAELAGAAREEMARDAERSRGNERLGREGT